MNRYSIFRHITEKEFEEMKVCLSGEQKHFRKNDIIMRHTDDNSSIGIVNKGIAFLLSISENGETGIIDYYEKGAVFGKLFSPDCDVNLNYIQAAENCEITFFSYDRLMNCCEDECAKHKKVLNNIVMDSLRKSLMHIDILSCRSIRGKLSTYIRYIRQQKDSDEFEIPVSLSDLADYLSVDRSAMMRELRKMKDENLISAKGSRITIIDL